MSGITIEQADYASRNWQGEPKGAIRLGSDEHRELFCHLLLDTFNPYKPAVIEWPKLSDAERDRLVSLPIWDIAVRTEGKARLNMLTYAERLKEPLLRKALELNGFEEGRHKEVLAKLVEAYGIKLEPEPTYVRHADAEWAYLITGYSECIDSFFAFGLFELAKRSGFFPPALVETFEPVMQEEGLGAVHIMVWDHNRDLMVQRAETIFDDPAASQYAWGIGYHWYEDWSGGQQMYGNVALVHAAYPDKHIVFTEGTPANFDSTGYGRWDLGEAYGRSMIHDFNSGAEGWTDWNILLDQHGGPNHVGNFCFAPIHADTRTGKLIYTNSYYYIGQFSKFIRPGAKRVLAAPSRSALLATAFVNPDGTVAVVVMNQTAQPVPYHLTVGGSAVDVRSLPHSIQTVVF